MPLVKCHVRQVKENVSSLCVDDSAASPFIVVVLDCPFGFLVPFGSIRFVLCGRRSPWLAHAVENNLAIGMRIA